MIFGCEITLIMILNNRLSVSLLMINNSI